MLYVSLGVGDEDFQWQEHFTINWWCNTKYRWHGFLSDRSARGGYFAKNPSPLVRLDKIGDRLFIREAPTHEKNVYNTLAAPVSNSCRHYARTMLQNIRANKYVWLSNIVKKDYRKAKNQQFSWLILFVPLWGERNDIYLISYLESQFSACVRHLSEKLWDHL